MSTWGSYASLINVNELTKATRHAAQDMLGFAQLCNAPTGGALGKGKGDTVQYTYFPNMSTTGGELDENEDMPEGSVTPVSGTYTIKEFGNSIPFTGKLDMLSRLSVEDDFMQALINDLKKLENSQAYTQFGLSHWAVSFGASVSANEFKTNNTPTVTAAADLSLANLRYVRRQAEKNLIPYFDGESYVYISGVDSIDNLAFDSTVLSQLAHDSGRASLNGEVGRIANCRLVKDTHKVAKLGSTQYDQGFLVGADAVLKEVAMAPEIRAQDRDFGRKVSIAYIFLGCWKKILNQTSHSKEHVIRVTTA